MKTPAPLKFISRHKIASSISGILAMTVLLVLFNAQTVSGQSAWNRILTGIHAETVFSGEDADSAAASSDSNLPEAYVMQADVHLVTLAVREASAAAMAAQAAIPTVSPTPVPTAVPTAAPTAAPAQAAPAQTAAAAAAAPAPAAEAPAAQASYSDTMKNQVFELVNTRRTENGLPALSMSDSLNSTANVRASEIAVLFEHTRPDGSSCFAVFPGGLTAMGENIAKGQTSAADVMNSWMNSEGHKANILSGDFTQIGISCYYDGTAYYWVQDFGG